MSIFNNICKKNYLLKEYTTWGCGGRCMWLAAPKNADQALQILKYAYENNVTVYTLGGGSNVLISDGTLNFSVLSSAELNCINLFDNGNNVTVEAGGGVLTKELLALSLKYNFGGVEFLTGIPGTLGGALFGNAGADGKSLIPFIDWVEGITDNFEIKRWQGNELLCNYRSCPWKHAPLFITKMAFCFVKDNKYNIINNIRHYAFLKKGQPIGTKTAGCVFKNPEGNSAGRLLDFCDCKCAQIGDARVSHHHANFIENCGNAKADDIFKLIQLCRKRVYENFGIILDYEVKFFGTFSS